MSYRPTFTSHYAIGGLSIPPLLKTVCQYVYMTLQTKSQVYKTYVKPRERQTTVASVSVKASSQTVPQTPL